MKYDFYYSKKHDEHMSSIGGYIGMPERKDTFVNGIKYTEMIESGKTPVTKKNFGEDLQLVYSGDTGEFKITHQLKPDDEQINVDLPELLKQRDELLNVVKHLLSLKHVKDLDGETPYYLEEMPKAWDKAKDLINKIEQK